MASLFNNIGLKTKLLLMMLSLCLISIGLLFILYARAERVLIREVKRHTDELSSAIQISVEEFTKEEEGMNERLKEYVEGFKKKGIRSISILNNENEVIASSDPWLIGKTMDIKGRRVRSAGNIQEHLIGREGHRNYDSLLPLVVGNEQLGYIHIAMRLDDFTAIMRANHLKRLVATAIIFAIGIGVSIFLSMRYIRPIQGLVMAVQRVAGGDLSQTLEVKGNDEIGELTISFNEMVKGLRERRELEERLRRSEHLSSIGQLAFAIAHEIRNPLNLLNLSIDHLKARYNHGDPVDKGEFLSIISNIKGEIHRLNRMATNLLDYGRPLKLNIQLTSLIDTVEEVMDLTKERLIEQGIEVERRFHGEIPEVPMDSSQIKTCLLNLFLNAIQAMPRGGRLTVETYLEDGLISISINDTGVGIAPEDLARVFEPYFTTKETGIGLGLAITRRIVEEHKGRIDIKSEPGKGTTATVQLPITREVL